MTVDNRDSTASARLVYSDDQLAIYCGQAANYRGPEPIDLVLTNPYGPLPPGLEDVPKLLHQWVHRRGELAAWAHMAEADLHLVSLWNLDREAVWLANSPSVIPVDLSDLTPTEEGWWPIELPRRLLAAYGHLGTRVFDGFMGRGTGGKAALEHGLRYVGVDERPEVMAVALAYLGVV